MMWETDAPRLVTESNARETNEEVYAQWISANWRCKNSEQCVTDCLALQKTAQFATRYHGTLLDMLRLVQTQGTAENRSANLKANSNNAGTIWETMKETQDSYKLYLVAWLGDMKHCTLRWVKTTAQLLGNHKNPRAQTQISKKKNLKAREYRPTRDHACCLRINPL